MIIENCWNGGVVIGAAKPVTAKDVVGVTGRQTLNGKPIGEGRSEDPFATLAWLANLLAERGRDLTAGMVVITGSLIPTFSVSPGDRCVFTVDGLGEAVMDVTN
jgi:2-keto-4-pentenoate hydratase